MHSTETTIESLNSLLRGEIAATETYQQALKKVGAEPEAAQIREIHAEHRDAANRLRQLVHEELGQPEQGSGGWGAWAKLVEGTAKLFGNSAALKALKEGEEHGIKCYKDALAQPLPTQAASLIQNILLPQTRRHVTTLDRLMERQ